MLRLTRLAGFYPDIYRDGLYSEDWLYCEESPQTDTARNDTKRNELQQQARPLEKSPRSAA